MSRRRAYPQPQYAVQQPPAQPSYNAYGVDQATQGFQNLNLQQQPVQPQFSQQPQQLQQQPQYPVNSNAQGYPAQSASAYGYHADPYAQAQAQAQVQSPVAPQFQQNQYQAGYQASDPYGQQTQASFYGTGPSVGGMGGVGAANAFPLNQLYTTDLMTLLPPPISELSLPPPPLIIPPTSTIVPGSETANASHEYFRSTLNVIPTTSSLLKKSKLPLALVVRPYTALHDSEEQVPVTKDTIISRCRRCRSYINPFISWTENGKRWRCNFCGLQNDVPSAFDYDELSQKAANRYERVELNHSCVEFIAPKEYMARAPQPIVYTFIIDVSANAVASGLTSTVARTILESLDRIPNANKTAKIAIIGVDSNLHFFRFREGLDEAPEMLIVSDLDEPFLPSPEGLLINLDENRKAIEKLLDDFPSYFEGTANPHFALGPALRSGHNLISSIGGKLVVFSATLPSIGEGKLMARDESQSGKPKEAQTLLNVADKFYKTFAVDCNTRQVTIDLFLTGSKYQDVATLSNLPRYTAGQTHFYPSWNCSSVEDVAKLSREISEHLSMEIALEAVLRVRCSTGFRMSGFFGNFFNRSSDLCSYPSFPRDQSYVIEVAIEETITKPVVYFQAAVLHTTCFGERRVRVINLAVPTSSKLDDIYASADQLAITNYVTHRAIEKGLSSSLGDAREYLLKSVVDILNVYRKELVPGNVTGSSPLQISTNLRLLPLLLFSLTKNMGFRDERLLADLRARALNDLGSLPLNHLIKTIYPTVYALHLMDDDCGLPKTSIDIDPETGEETTITSTEIKMPEPQNASNAGWQSYGLYLIDNGIELFLWVSGGVTPALVADVFGTDNLYEVATGKVELPEFSFEESEFNYKIRQIIGKLREQKDSIVWKNLYVCIGPSEEEPLEIASARSFNAMRSWVLSNLVEDRSLHSKGYRDFLTELKTKIAQ
ncbi:COPII subunit [Candidozyma auris]|uniref:Protein transport protein SEC24 n=2 Tax=Candidozyma auris TaxID=498019 RepID=A0A2H0ZFV2_CANAR|nr:hypothetical protein QG37_03788 [[Candida] auris]PIS49531.1 hypothetical protein B9J08_004554 [[Candida] auris]QWW25055.1 hypothetical protein CA7LBN_003937 [[Candida] auris]